MSSERVIIVGVTIVGVVVVTVVFVVVFVAVVGVVTDCNTIMVMVAI